jgi:hypothetical protein
MDEQIAKYIREHRGRYTREAVTKQLLAAGHDAQAIDATWTAVNAADFPRPASVFPHARYTPFIAGLVALGAIPAFLAGSSGLYLSGLWGVSYLIAAPIVMLLGIGLTAISVSRGWFVVVILGAFVTLYGLWLSITLVDVPVFLFAAVAAAATIAAVAIHRYGAQWPILAYALPVVGWLLVTGVCAAPLVTGGM